MDQKLLNQIERLIQQRPVAKEALASFRELVFIMREAEPDARGVKLENRLKGIKQEEGFPVFSRVDLPLDLDSASGLLERFLEHLKATDREDREGFKKALQCSEAEPEWPKRLFKAILGQDEKALSGIAKEVDLDPMVLQFLGGMAMRPSLCALRDAVSDTIDKDGWEFGYCPLCGSQPDMAYFEKTGKRYLHCGLCAEEWPFPRVRCPFCDNHNHKTLGYFQAEEEEGFRVYFCKQCQRYVKTLDKRVIEEPAPLELENLATIHLDVLAAEHGFK
jgi:FdhE protein